jgi:DNA mismatch endonuclease, patch repair protein
MQANRRNNTQPELLLRRELHSRGLRYRIDYRVLGRFKADIVFPKQRVAIYVDGCFWHACPTHGTRAKSNAIFWASKLSENVRRDRRTVEALRSDGWRVLRVWEHEAPSVAADKIALLLGAGAC